MPSGPEPPHRPDSLVELRILDGANLYFPRPAVKVVLNVDTLAALGEQEFGVWAERLGAAERRPGPAGTDRRTRALLRVLPLVVRQLAAASGTGRLGIRARPGAQPDQVVVAFPWRRRGKARALGVALAALVDGTQTLAEACAEVAATEDGTGPAVPRPKVPVVAVTGTNGKTTTTRLIAHMGRCDGRKVAWSNTDGVYVDGICVDEGDWSGFGGAGRVLAEPGLGLAVLETARGGILLRGVGATHNDVSVVTNITADHLGLQGINTLDELAEVKQVLVRITKKTGWVVVNGDDPRTLGMRMASKARPFVFSLDPDSPGIRAALGEGGRGATVLDGRISVVSGDWHVDELISVLDVPITLAGLSIHNVANALAAAAAGLAVGLPRAAVVKGLRTFRPDPALNPGRLNLYDVDGAIVIVDLAHNEDSLHALLLVAQGLRAPGAQVHTILGLAGDRGDDVIRLLGEIAARGSQTVVVAEKERYLRGRDRAAMTELLLAGVRAGGLTGAQVYPDELSGLQAAVAGARPGDVVAFMCHADRAECDAWLRQRGALVLTDEQVTGLVRANGGGF